MKLYKWKILYSNFNWNCSYKIKTLFISIFNSYLINRRAARDETELKRKKTQQSGSTTPPKNNSLSDHCKPNSPPIPTNDPTDM